MKICDLKFKIGYLKKRGFSIVELVFAMCFLTLIILGVVSLQSGNLAMINRQNNQIQANFYANQGVQILKAIGYTAINTAVTGCTNPCKLKFDPGIKPYVLIPYGNLNEPVGDTIFERNIEIDSDNLENAYKTTVYVEWVDSTGEHRRMVDGELENADVKAKTIIF